MARLHPQRARSVVGVSVPFVQWPAPPTQLMKMMYGDRFFYILYFQEPGVAEGELDADPYDSMCRVLWGRVASVPVGDVRAASDGGHGF
jgi:hypothetical protein